MHLLNEAMPLEPYGSDQALDAPSRIITTKDMKRPFPGYKTYLGKYYQTKIEEFLASSHGKRLIGKVNMLITSPPFPLNNKKSYGNLNGDEYLSWLEDLSHTRISTQRLRHMPLALP
jgi:hypothetical protein